MAIWVAVGGRGTLVGAALGAVLVNGAKSWFTGSFPDLWLYFLGALFIVRHAALAGWGDQPLRPLRAQGERA